VTRILPWLAGRGCCAGTDTPVADRLFALTPSVSCQMVVGQGMQQQVQASYGVAFLANREALIASTRAGDWKTSTSTSAIRPSTSLASSPDPKATRTLPTAVDVIIVPGRQLRLGLGGPAPGPGRRQGAQERVASGRYVVLHVAGLEWLHVVWLVGDVERDLEQCAGVYLWLHQTSACTVMSVVGCLWTPSGLDACV
jgi:hypothetical protein